MSRVWSQETLELFGKLLLTEFGPYDDSWSYFPCPELATKDRKKSWDYIFGEICRYNKKKGLQQPKSVTAVQNIYSWATCKSQKSFTTMPHQCRYAYNIAKAFVISGFFTQTDLDRLVEMSFTALDELSRQRTNRRAAIRKISAVIKLKANKEPELEEWIEKLQELVD